MIKKRRPQPICKCSHAKNRHYFSSSIAPSGGACCYCFHYCLKFEQDNLKTLEKLAVYEEEKKIQFNFPCICSHKESEHTYVGAPIYESWCSRIMDSKSTFDNYVYGIPCPCGVYKPDNLRYLEILSQKKGKKYD